MKPGLFITAVLFASVTTSLAASDAPRISATMPWNNSEGYTPVVLSITAPRDTQLQIEIASGTSGGSTSVALTAGEARRLTVLLPAEANPWSSSTLTWRTDHGAVGEFMVSPTHRHRTIAVGLIGNETSLPMAPWNEALSTINWALHIHHGGSDLVARFAVEDLPDRWQGYPTWLTLVLDSSSQARLSPAQREAITAWTLAGGLLVLPEGGQAPPWRQLGAVVHVSGDPAIDPVLQRQFESKRDEGNESWDLDEVLGAQRVPATGFMIVALCFALLVGPVNLLWVRRRNARHLFLITTPLLSLGTCVILLGADIVLHGVSLRRHVQQLVVLDQVSNRAAAWTLVTATSGFAVSTLDLDHSTEAFRIEGDQGGPRYYRGGYSLRGSQAHSTFRLAWGDRQTATGTWGTARTPTTIRYRSVMPQRARVDVRVVDDTLHVVNGLGVELRTIAIHDGLRSWNLDQLAAGASAVLEQPVTGQPNLARMERFGSAAQRAIQQQLSGWWLVAATNEPLAPISGPSGIDVAPPFGMILARLADPSGATP